MAFGDKPYGLHDVKVTPVSGSQKDFPIAQSLKFGIRVLSGELSGDDQLVAVAANVEAIDWELEAGGISLDAYGIMMGMTPTTSDTTPSAYYTLAVASAARLPYFKIYGKSLGDGTDDIHVKIPKAKITDTIEGTLAGGEFMVTSCKGIGVADTNGHCVIIVQNETAQELPTT
jgi:hypothetical protein